MKKESKSSNWKDIIGIAIIVIGTLIIILQPFVTTTGAVIDLETGINRLWFFIGLGMVAIGIIMQFARERKQQEEKEKG